MTSLVCGSGRPLEYYRNMLPDVPIVLCHSCNHFFHEEDWEFSVMSKGVCPFCRAKSDGADNGSCLSFPSSKSGSAPTGAAMPIH